MMPHLEPIDTEMTPMRSAVRDRQVELGIGASTGCFHCEAFDKSCYPSLVKERGEVEVIKGDWTYVGQQYGQAMVAGKYAKILFVSMERPLSKPEEFEETQYQFRTACLERSNPHMGGTDVELEFLLDPTPPEQRCQQFALTNSVRCRPSSPNAESQSTSTMIAKCQAHTKSIIEILTPDIIVTQGKYPSEGIVEMFDSKVVFESDNGLHSRSLRKAEVRRGGGVLFLLTAHPAIRPHSGFRWRLGGLPDYLHDAINEVRDLYLANDREKPMTKSRIATDEQLKSYAELLPSIYREILIAFPRLEPYRKPGYGLAFQTLAVGLEDFSLGQIIQACEQLERQSLVKIKHKIFVHPTQLGERLIGIITGRSAPVAQVPELPALPT